MGFLSIKNFNLFKIGKFGQFAVECVSKDLID